MNVAKTGALWRKGGHRWWWLALAVILFLVVLGTLEPIQAQDGTEPGLLDVVAAIPRDFAPQYGVDENGQPVGFAIDVMDQIAALAGLRVTYLVEDTWADVNAALLDGRADFIPNMGITPEREADYDFTAPVETFPVSIFVRQPTTDIQSTADLAGHTVAAVEFNVAVSLLQDHPGVETIVFDDAPSALFALLSGEVNALVYPQPVLLKIAQSIGVEERIKVVGEPVIEVKRAIAVRKDSPELLARLKEAVNSFVDTAEYQQIYVKWYGQPQPFWTATRVAWAMGGLLLLTLATMAAWRYFAVLRLNRRLVENVAERKQTEEALRETRDYLDKLIRYASAPIIVWNPALEITRFNRAFEHLTGYTADEVIGQELCILFPKASRDESLIKIEYALSGEYWESVEVPIVRKDGDVRLALWNSANIYAEEDATLLATIAQGIDVTERKRAAEAVRESEQWLSTTLRGIGDAVIATDAKGLVSLVNPVAEDLTGWDEAEAVGKPVEDVFNIINEKTGERSENPVARVLREGVVVGLANHTVLIAKDGTKRPIADSGAPTRDEEGNIIGTVMVFRDITERKQVEEALKKRTEEIKLLYEAGQQLGQTLDTDVIYSRLHDFLSGIVDCDSLAVSSFDPENGLIHCAFAVIEGNQQDAAKFPPLPLNPQGRGTQSVAIRTGKSLLIKDYQDWTKTSERAYYVNEGGKVVEHDKAPADADVARSALIVPMKLEGQVLGVIQVMSYRLDAYTENDLRILESLASQIAVAGNNALLYRQAQDEITQRKQAEEELREHRDHLEELVTERTVELDRRVAEVEQLNQGMTNLLEDLQSANRRVTRTARRLEQTNVELESFTYSVSHDLRAPLRHVDSFAQLLLKREAARLEPTSARYLQNIVEATDKMRRLIDDLLALSRTGRAEMHLRPVAPNEIIEKAREELAPTLTERRITWEIAPLPAVQADPGLLRIVWDNLLSNAVKYTGPRPEARIEIGATPPDEEGRVTFFIRDNGVGFDPQYTHKLFGTFQRLHRDEEFEGSGIGLATVRRIVNRHGGRVWAEGEPDRGATFYFTLSVLID